MTVDLIEYNMKVFDTLFDRRDPRNAPDPADDKPDNRKQWSSIPLKEQGEIVTEWMCDLSNIEHRSVSDGLVTDLLDGGNGLDYLARAMVKRGVNVGWVM
jgi:hypothetical protein